MSTHAELLQRHPTVMPDLLALYYEPPIASHVIDTLPVGCEDLPHVAEADRGLTALLASLREVSDG